jgi:hypothetical protein
MIKKILIAVGVMLVTSSVFGQKWVHVKDLSSSNEFEFYGIVSLSLYGSRLAVGAIQEDVDGNTNGHVRIYERDGTDWLQVGTTLYGDAAWDKFGSSVSLNADGSRLAVSAPWYGPFNKGQVKVLEWDGISWVQVGQGINGDNPSSFWGNTCLNNSGDILAIGVGSNGVNTPGMVRVYQLQGAFWKQLGSDLTDKIPLNDFGTSISLSGRGHRVAIGVTGLGPAPGSVVIYDWNGSDWIQVGSTISGVANGSQFGRSVDLSNDGSTIAIGANTYDGPGQNIGQTMVFHLDGDWNQIGSSIDGVSNDDLSGDVVQISPDGSLLAIASPFNDDNGNNAGHVRVFEFVNNSWIQFQDVYNGDASDMFAGSMSISYLDEGEDQYILAMGSMYHDVPFFQGGGVRTFAYVLEPISPTNTDDTRISIFPNPAQQILTIETDNGIIESVTILNESTGEHFIETQSKSVDISMLPPGKFIVTVKLQSGKIHSEHLIVN